VVIAATGLSLILLVPVLFAKPREQAIRTLCAANLAQIGKAMLLYAGDNAGVLPRAGGRNTIWGETRNWLATDRRTAFGLALDGTGGKASISASFYLLVKHLGIPPQVFVCKADRGTTEFKLSGLIMPDPRTLADLWDFGPVTDAVKHCSYTYHVPFSVLRASTIMPPSLSSKSLRCSALTRGSSTITALA
jgi:hypothetical protein